MSKFIVGLLILIALLLLRLSWLESQQQRAVSAIAEHLILRSEIERLQQQRPCEQEGADARTLEARR